jgi:pimeloyl-ACP methyl ester carboxylesterase
MRNVTAKPRTSIPIAFMQRHPVLSVAGLSIVLAWLPMCFISIIPYVPLALLAAFAPVCAVLMVTAAGHEDSNLHALFHLPSGIQWYAALFIPVLWTGIFVMLNLFFPGSGAYYPLIPILMFTAALSYAFMVSEKIVWRGYLLPKLLEGHSRLVASLILSGQFMLTYGPLYLLGALVDPNGFTVSVSYFAAAVVFYVWLWHHLHIISPLKQRRLTGTLFRSVLRGLLAICVAGVALLFTACLYQTIALVLDQRRFPPPNELISVDGHPMYMHCTGMGSPTVLLEAGAFSYAGEWYRVQQQLEQTNRVCSYDRAGNGWSETVVGLRDGLTLTRELHVLLDRAAVKGPYILVGHSLGGVLETIYAAQYPDEVLGLVLVDSAIPMTWPDKNSFEQYRAQQDSVYAIMSALTRLGLTRLIVEREFEEFGYPSEVIPMLTALKSTTQAVDTWDAEVRLAQWALSQQLHASANLGKLPVVVLWASHPELTTAKDRQLLEKIWSTLPISSSNMTTRIVEGASHGSIVGTAEYAAQIVVAVSKVIDAAHTGQPIKQ